MMQTGGRTSGGATLAQQLQFAQDAKTAKEYQKKEAERQKRGRLFGSVGGLGMGLLGAALAPATGGLSLALASGAGTALGKYTGESIGAGKAGSVDRSGTVYNQQGFRDIETGGREYDKGKFGRAAMSGMQAALTAGLSPGGGAYGKVAGKFRPSTSSLGGIATSFGLPQAPMSLASNAPATFTPSIGQGAIAGTQSGLTGLNFSLPETLGAIPSSSNLSAMAPAASQGSNILQGGLLDDVFAGGIYDPSIWAGSVGN